MPEPEIVIFLHKTCGSSYNLYKQLKDKGLASKVSLREATSPVDHRGRLIWSVPWVILDGTPLAADPVDASVIEAALHGGQVQAGDYTTMFMEAVLHSALATSMVLLARSLSPVLDMDLASAAVRAPLTGIDPSKVVEEVRLQSSRLYDEWSGKLARALAMGFVREAWWAFSGDIDGEKLEALVGSGGFRTWVIGKGSLGRVGLPSDPRVIARYPEISEAEDFIIKTGGILLRRVAREQTAILGDAEWMRA